MNFLLKIYKGFEKLIQPLHDWILENHGNPLLWIGVLIGSFLIFSFVYDRLRKG